MRASTGSNATTPRTIRRQAGFTMIEVMVAIMLSSIAIIGILALYMTQTRASSYSRHTSEASVLAADGLERLRTMGTPTGGTEANLTEMGSSGGIFTRVSTVAGTISPYDVTVTVSWTEDGATRQVRVWGKL